MTTLIIYENLTENTRFLDTNRYFDDFRFKLKYYNIILYNIIIYYIKVFTKYYLDFDKGTFLGKREFLGLVEVPLAQQVFEFFITEN